MILTYVRNKHVYTTEPENNLLLVYAASEETFFSARVEVTVKLRCALYESWDILQNEGAFTEDNFRRDASENLPFLKESCYAFAD
ncbi:MAG: hypothetical protein STSR0004_08660 [Peptococcaceae bacterium]